MSVRDRARAPSASAGGIRVTDDDKTPPDHTVIGLRIEAALLPSWFAEVERIAARMVRRMVVIEKPDEWIVQCELPKSQVDAFQEALQDAWDRFPHALPEFDA
jgi:hypothetical protein